MIDIDKYFSGIREMLNQAPPKDVVVYCSPTFYRGVRNAFIKHKKIRCAKLRVIKYRKIFRKRRRK